MKKILALVLVLCMMTAALPAFAETAAEPSGSGLINQLSDILNGEGSLEEKVSVLSGMFSELKNSFTGSDKQFSAIISALIEKLQGLLQSGEGSTGSLLSGLKDKLAGSLGGDSSKLSGLLSSLTGGKEGEGLDLTGLLGSLGEGSEDFDLGSLLGILGGDDAEVEDDGETLEEMIERLNREEEADTGDGVPNKKAAESVEEFYGKWTETKFVLNGEDYDASEYEEGLFIGENTFYGTENGEKAEYYPYSEKAEMFIRDGVLKVKSEEGHWSTMVLTENGEIVMSGSSLLFYYVRDNK